MKAKIKSQNIICTWKCEVVTQCQIQKPLVQVISALSRNCLCQKHSNCLAAFTERRLNEDSTKKSSREAEKLDLSRQLTFLKVPSNSAIFPDSKNKKHKGNKQCGYWSLTKNYHEHWTCRGLSEMCQPFKIQFCTWGLRGACWFPAGKYRPPVMYLSVCFKQHKNTDVPPGLS